MLAKLALPRNAQSPMLVTPPESRSLRSGHSETKQPGLTLVEQNTFHGEVSRVQQVDFNDVKLVQPPNAKRPMLMMLRPKVRRVSRGSQRTPSPQCW